MTLLQLPRPLTVMTPLGIATAEFVHIPNFDDNYTFFGCWICESGEFWWFDNTRVRQDTSITTGRPTFTPIRPLPGLEEHVRRHKRAPLSARLGDGVHPADRTTPTAADPSSA